MADLPRESNWLWSHKQKGGEYELRGQVTVQTNQPVYDMDFLQLYEDNTGRLWARPIQEFAERFHRVSPLPPQKPAPIDMVLYCPRCGLKHIDRSNVGMVPVRLQGLAWDNPPHTSHKCLKEDGGCGYQWRPADIPTNGVEVVKTRHENDSPIEEPMRRRIV